MPDASLESVNTSVNELAFVQPLGLTLNPEGAVGALVSSSYTTSQPRLRLVRDWSPGRSLSESSACSTMALLWPAASQNWPTWLDVSVLNAQ